MSEQPEREILGAATFFLAPFIRCFLFIVLIVLFIFLIDMFNHAGCLNAFLLEEGRLYLFSNVS